MTYKKLIPVVYITFGLTFNLLAVGQDRVSVPETESVRANGSVLAGNIAGRIKNAATDQYLNNAKVSIVGTNIVAFTDMDGSYRVADVPAGAYEIEVVYTGLDTQRISVAIIGGTTLERNIDLTSLTRYGKDSALVRLDPYKVGADRELNAQTVATNEQRYAPNVKNVMDTNSFGSLMANSVGEFMKFIPGVTVGYSGNEITEFSVRGIGGAMNSVTQDGTPMVFGSYSASSRIFNPYTSDINSTARIEVTKVPTPSTPADSIGGTINLVSKSVFDNAKASGHFNFGVNVNSRYIGDVWWDATPSTRGDKNDYKTQPNGSFDYSLPFNKNFGIFISGLYFPKAGNNSQLRTGYVSTGTGTGASFAKPYLQSVFELDDPRVYTKLNFSVRADWRVTQHSVLSFSLAVSENKTLIGDSYRNSTTGTIGTSTVSGGTSLTYGENFTSGATGRGGVQLVGLFQEFNGGTTAPSVSYRFDDGRWKIHAAASHMQSFMEKDNPDGPFSSLIASLRSPVRVSIAGAGYGRKPDSIQVFDNNNQPVDINDINNYKVDSGQEIFYRNKAEVTNLDFKIKRRLNLFSFPSSLEVGGTQTTKEYENRSAVKNLTYNRPATTSIPASFLYQVYRTQTGMTNGDTPPFLSPDRVWAEWKADPTLFTQTAAQAVATENSRRNASQNITETVTATYLQAEAHFFNGRLNVLTGVRFEKTVDEGDGVLFDPNAVFVRNADGTFAHDELGARIRKPEAGAAGSMEQLILTTKENGAHAKRSYDGYYPSLHLTYVAQENLLIRAAYAKTYGRPDFTQIIPGTTIQEADLSPDQQTDPNSVRGTLTVRNTGLKPWSADNYDLSVEYYTKGGGLFSAGVFLKEIKDFFGAAQRIATQADLDELGLDSQYVGWSLNSTFNAGDARITGVELNARQSLNGLGDWGRYFTLFANATKLKLEGNRQANFSSFIPKSANWGVSFARDRFYAGVKWNYRGLDRRTPDATFGPDGYIYFKSAITMDVDLSYNLTPRVSLAASVANITNVSHATWLDYGQQTPDYARTSIVFNSGAQYSFAIKGSF